MKREVRIADEGMAKAIEQLIDDKEYVRNNLIYHLVNRNNVRPGEIFDPVFGDDIGLVYRIAINDSSAMVVNEDFVQNMFNGNLNRVRKLARQNTPRLNPARLTGLNQMISELMGCHNLANEPEIAYILTNEQKSNGAGCILYPQTLELIREKVNGPFYVIPSSVHEVLIFPMSSGNNPEALKEIIGQVNTGCVHPLDYLGDDPIHFIDVLKAINKMLDEDIQNNEELIEFQNRIMSRLVYDVFGEV